MNFDGKQNENIVFGEKKKPTKLKHRMKEPMTKWNQCFFLFSNFLKFTFNHDAQALWFECVWSSEHFARYALIKLSWVSRSRSWSRRILRWACLTYRQMSKDYFKTRKFGYLDSGDFFLCFAKFEDFGIQMKCMNHIHIYILHISIECEG